MRGSQVQRRITSLVCCIDGRAGVKQQGDDFGGRQIGNSCRRQVKECPQGLVGNIRIREVVGQ